MLAQRHVDGPAEWTTVDSRTGDLQKDWFPDDMGTDTLRLRVTGADPQRAARVSASDYTAPLWLPFIGSFCTDDLGRVDHY